MSKKKQHRIKIGNTKPAQLDFQGSLEKLAHHLMVTERKLTPLIIHDKMPVSAALVLIACYNDAMILGKPHAKTHRMTGQDIIGATNLLIRLWRKGLFIPSPQFPYTLADALQELENEE